METLTPREVVDIGLEGGPFQVPTSLLSTTNSTTTLSSYDGVPLHCNPDTTTTTPISSDDLIITKRGKGLSQISQITISNATQNWTFRVSFAEKALLLPFVESFSYSLHQDKLSNADVNSGPLATCTLAAAYLEHLLERNAQRGLIIVVLEAFETDFLFDTDIHTMVSALDRDSRTLVLRTYFSAGDITGLPGRTTKSALLSASQKGEARIYAIFGGQGTCNMTCLQDLRDLHSSYGRLMEDIIEVATETLAALILHQNTVGFYENYGFDIKDWIERPETAPDQSFIASAPISFPIIGILSLSQYAIACKAVGKLPGEVRGCLRGVTGHSQGVIVAAAVASSGSWEEFYESTRVAIEILFWIGIESHLGAPASSLSTAIIKDSVDCGEGQPSSMLSIRGLDIRNVHKILDKINNDLPTKDHVYVALINSRTNAVVAGPRRSLRGVNLRLRQIKAENGSDQSRIPFNQRKPIIDHHFLPISAPFHSPHLADVVPRVLNALRLRYFDRNNLVIPVYDTSTGADLRVMGSSNIIESLVHTVTVDQVNWPKACQSMEGTHILDFGPGRIGHLIHRIKSGTGLRVINVAELFPSSKEIGGRVELFSSFMPPLHPNWAELYKPRIVRNNNGTMRLETKMTRLLGVPPIMVAGMTPTTVSWDFVASVMKAGYHVELAGGGFHNAHDFENALRNISEAVPQCGITCNLIYVNPRAISWQIPLIRQLVRKGYQIDGLTIGAGIPSAEIVREYIDTIGLKHISFKPGSQEAILEVIRIAKSHPHFAIGLQWTGGRGGGHHSFEDFHIPMLETYGQIRECPNIVLIAGSGFGGSEDTYPYLTGEWSQSLGYASMPFDGILLGSRMMVAKEAHTSPQAKELIIQAEGIEDSDWHKTYEGPAGGVVTVISEMGQPIHKLATRGVLLWKDLDTKIFSIRDPTKRLVELEKNKRQIIDRLNKDFQKPWFAVNSVGVCELEEMTYADVLRRLIFLMYVESQNRWIDLSYEKFVVDFVSRVQERLVPLHHFSKNRIGDPPKFLRLFLRCYPSAENDVLHPEDVSFFIGLCKRRGQKPVNFIPRLDENFEHWFKKDSLWQAEDIESVINQDAQRVCILHGPVAARYSKATNETCKDILDGISNAHTDMLYRELGSPDMASFLTDSISEFTPIRKQELYGAFITDLPLQKKYHFTSTGALPDADTFAKHLIGNTGGWAQACLADTSIIHGLYRQSNPIRAVMVPQNGHVITINYNADKTVKSIKLSTVTTKVKPSRRLLELASQDGKHVTLTLFEPGLQGASDFALAFNFTFSSERISYRVIEDLHGRNERIKRFYAELWLGHYPLYLSTATAHTEFSGEPFILSKSLVQDFLRVIGNSDTNQSIQENTDEFVPLDICIVAAWKELVKPLLITATNGDLLRLLHRSNQFEYHPEAEPLRIDDILQTRSRITSVTIQPSGKLIEVTADLSRNGIDAVKLISSFIVQGSFSDYDDTFQSKNEPEMHLFIGSVETRELLLSRDWVHLDFPNEKLLDKTLAFKTNTKVTLDSAGAYTSLQVMGTIYDKSATGSLKSVGKIYFECGPCKGNAVLNFLSRHGYPAHKVVPVLTPGWNGDSSWRIKIPMRNSLYARVSQDTNPIHVSPVFAMYAQLPGTVTHGMYTSAAVRRVIEKASAEADFTRFRRFDASFEGMVMPGNQLRVDMQHVAMIEGRMILNIQAYNNETGDKVLEAVAEIEQAPTVYVFSGQGSQERGMGMSLYDTSPAAKDLWDRGNRHLLDLYGFSIIDIVKDDPKTLTVHFGGRRGRQIRENYLAMTTKVSTADGTFIEEPILRGLSTDSSSYTFQDPRGLLFSTQFAQPALIIMELASFEDMRSRGLIHERAAFAGHSLGEYGALGALASFMPMESLLSLVFYRGLAMQVAMKRDEHGHTDFSMVAVNPSRVGRGFNKETGQQLVNFIREECGVLLEVVNYNVQGQQYVCAGHLRALWVLTQVLNSLAQNPSAGSNQYPISVIQSLVQECASTAPSRLSDLVLERGSATIPLSGIDVPFHSTYLRDGIASYRSFLEGKILPENIDPEKLVDRFIPNVMGKTFSVSRSYVREVAEVTGSEELWKMLDKWPIECAS